MATTEKQILNRLYFVAVCIFLFAFAVVGKLVSIQLAEGDDYRRMAEEQTIKNFIIQPNRGNLYSDDGSLLATSATKYDIRFDALASKPEVFEEHLKPLADSLSQMLGKPSSYYQNIFKKARTHKNRYLLIVRNLNYSQQLRIKSFPLFKLGGNKGGIIVEQRTVREHPLGRIAARSIGYERYDENGYVTRVGLEGAYGEYLRGEIGHRLKQKIARGQWKPISDRNEKEPKDGYDVVSTININMQDIAHHALLGQLEKYKASHGSVVVMEVASGEVKAISNLGRTSKGTYYEKLNYAVGESHEPGSTFKLMSLMAAFEDKAIDTSYIVDTEKGVLTFYGKKVRDSKYGGYGKITAAEAFERSSNTGVVKIIDEFYKDDPERFVDRLYNMGLNNKLGLSIKGEGVPYIPHPDDNSWSGITLQWMAYGYNVSLTPLQTLTFYNAVANNGEMVKPRLIKEVRSFNKIIKKFDKEVLNPSICSRETIGMVQQMLKNVVEKEHGTGHDLYSDEFSMAGKTGTCQKDYASKNSDALKYISSFVGYFPADNPKYSCIVVIHEPDKSKGYYGADVSGPVFKSIAQKIYTNSPLIDTIEELEKENESVAKNYESFYAKAQKKYQVVPNVSGMSGMDAIALLENLGLRVKVKGNGKVTSQSLKPGEKIKPQKTIVLQLI